MKSKTLTPILVTSFILNLVLTGFLIWGKTEFLGDKPTEELIPVLSEVKTIETEDSWMEPIPLDYDQTCLQKNVNCSDLGQVQIGRGQGTIRARLFPVLNEPEKVEVRFYKGEEAWVIPSFKTDSFLDVNADWFGLKIWYNNSGAIYIGTTGGHEGSPGYFISYLGDNERKWEEFRPWNYVKDVFPDTIEPPFSLKVGTEYIQLTEENYCCDTVHSDTPERNATRLVYVLKKEYDEKGGYTYSVVEQGKVKR